MVHVKFIKPPIKVEDNSIGTKSNNLLREPAFMVESPRKKEQEVHILCQDFSKSATSDIVQKKLDHGIMYESVALE